MADGDKSSRWYGGVALVTGASSGIGAAVTKKLVILGMKVIGCARSIDRIQETASKLKRPDVAGSLHGIQCDLSKPEEILSMFAEIKEKYGGVDVCVNNAGLAHPASLLEGHEVPRDNHMYSATKHAVTALTEGLRQELREIKSHIRVTALSPGLVHTEFRIRMFPDDPDIGKKVYGSNPCLQPEDLAEAVLYVLQAPPHVQIHDIIVRPTDEV